MRSKPAGRTNVRADPIFEHASQAESIQRCLEHLLGRLDDGLTFDADRPFPDTFGKLRGIQVLPRVGKRTLRRAQRNLSAAAPPKIISSTNPTARSDVHAGVSLDMAARAAHRPQKSEADKVMMDLLEERSGVKRSHRIGDLRHG